MTVRRTLIATLLVAAPSAVATTPVAVPPASADQADTTPPQVHYSWSRFPRDFDLYWNHPVSFKVWFTDDESGLDESRSQITVQFRRGPVDGEHQPRTAREVSISQEGTTTVGFDIVDNAGNRTAWDAMVFFDSIAPVVSTPGLPAEGSNLVEGSRVPVGLDCVDGGDPDWSSGILDGSCGYTEGTLDGRVDTSAPGPLTLSARASDQAGNVTTVTRHYTVVAARGRPQNKVKPAISGVPLVSATLTADPGQWSGSPASYSYQWMRDGLAIPAATAATYQSVEADRRHKIAVQVTATNSYGTRSTGSAAVKIR